MSISDLFRLISRFDDSLRIQISCQPRHGGVLQQQMLFTRHNAPAIVRCPRIGCTGTGFSLVGELQRAVAAAKGGQVHYTHTVECLGTLLGEHGPLAACGQLFLVNITGKLARRDPHAAPPAAP